MVVRLERDVHGNDLDGRGGAVARTIVQLEHELPRI